MYLKKSNFFYSNLIGQKLGFNAPLKLNLIKTIDIVFKRSFKTV